MSDDLQIVAYKVESALAGLADLLQNGPALRIVHRFRTAGAVDCVPGEEVFAVFLVQRGRQFQLRLSLSGRLLLDYLARHRHYAQSATQIAAGIQASDFYQKHASNAGKSPRMRRKIARSAVKIYIRRLRQAFAAACEEAEVVFSADKVIVSEQTVANEVGYKVHARVEWSHVDSPESRRPGSRMRFEECRYDL